jgi:hypothetical protein
MNVTHSSYIEINCWQLIHKKEKKKIVGNFDGNLLEFETRLVGSKDSEDPACLS